MHAVPHVPKEKDNGQDFPGSEATGDKQRWPCETRNIMSEKFNPAPNKHAADPKQAVKSDKNLQSELDKGLEGTFPASDPASTEPAKSKRDAG
jgi:hypothetical protein